MTDFAVAVRPEIQDRRKIYPCDYTVRIPFTCVHGPMSGDMVLASAPLLGLRFRCFKSDNLKNLFVQHVQSRLKGVDPMDLYRVPSPRVQAPDCDTGQNTDCVQTGLDAGGPI